jgi:hypothetical protein
MTSEQHFEHYADLALSALADASKSRGKLRKGHMQIAMIYGEMAVSRLRPATRQPVHPNGNGAAANGAAAHTQ